MYCTCPECRMVVDDPGLCKWCTFRTGYWTREPAEAAGAYLTAGPCYLLEVVPCAGKGWIPADHLHRWSAPLPVLPLVLEEG